MPHLQPKKRFGQHFLHDRGIVQRILDAFDPQPGDTLVEIGPGPGALTRPLLERCTTLHVVELDRDLAARLRADYPPAQLVVHEADALKFDFCSLVPAGGRLRIIGNLPYNISTPLLFHLLEQRHCDVQGRTSAAGARTAGAAIGDMLFMLQKEVVDRMAAAPGSKDYGRLSVMLQWQLHVEKLFDVRPGAFTPPPKVDSSVVRLVPHALPPIQVRDATAFAHLVRAAFAQRRKTLRNNLKGLMTAETLESLGIDPQRRAETLTLGEFAKVANALPPAA
jgi:16S rRNA (adenine1518-N6/adenine1519-N6)-dimethyltransferase